MQKLFKFFLNLIPRTLLIKLSFLVRPLVAFFLRGEKYTDPIDGNSFRKFLPYGYENVRENVLSPSTLSLERHRLLWLYLQNETPFFSEKIKLLHFAPEQAFYKRFKKLKNIEYTTTDLNSPIADVKADICNLPFQDDSYDLIICNHVLEHIPDDRKAMSELYRVLKPGGTAILQVPYEEDRTETYEDDTITDPKERARIFGQYDHVRIYGLDYYERLRSVGFKVKKVDYINSLTKKEIDTYRLAAGELIPVATK
ncbi:class I SAM-dependent methyltransferase [Cochleicola gelatinilyticus]|uniref:SAM-dependent methyltransferase n=1 Tax=Cochleicola gelatinilyticus TaxID=1763537 RepID=A0A167F3A3_9FLAO|nr:class I SAM-dependent methyltransferase [Cochleicola gelatinilyticus]OAB76146.1 SAM-dependent methyltransferase [Cochleicola gelatinilyticus]